VKISDELPSADDEGETTRKQAGDVWDILEAQRKASAELSRQVHDRPEAQEVRDLIERVAATRADEVAELLRKQKP
jgi:hypothetical protein